MLTDKMIEELNRKIEEGYGSPIELAKSLDKAVEMLFYVDEETFDKQNIRNAVGSIYHIKNALMIPVEELSD